jgi:serine/threonine protein kinase
MPEPVPPDFDRAQLFEDQSTRWRAGERPLVETYLAQHPFLREAPTLVLELIAHEVSLRLRCGEQPSLSEYTTRFPEHTERISALFRELPTQQHHPAPGEQPRPVPNIPGYDNFLFIEDGGQGEVWKARHRALNRIVALKVLLPGHPGERQENLLRFRREGQLIAHLDHPNIVRVYDHAEHEQRLYLTMEFLEGGSLKARLASGTLPGVEEAVQLVAVLARAVHHAHLRGIIHRDLKPSNILFDRDGTPKLADFGLAKSLDAGATELTRTRAVLGTARYMAPEQAAGKIRQVGPASDIYALGAVLYECFTGRPPFLGESWLETLDMVRFEEPTPPNSLRPGLPSYLNGICLRCLSKDPKNRHPTALALAEDLERFADPTLDFEPEQPEGQASVDPLPSTIAPEGKSSTPPPDDEDSSEEPRTVVPPEWTDPGTADRPPNRFAFEGIVIPGYELIERIARGGMGVVYRARQISLGRIVALKMLHDYADMGARWLRLLRREARLVAELAHPNIVQIYDLGEHAGVVYIAMEYVPGGTLHEVFRDELPDPMHAVELVEQVARAVGFIHHHGLIHRDVKPSNVLMAPPVPRKTPASGRRVSATDRYGVGKLTDFGLARRLVGKAPDAALAGDSSGVADDPVLTQVGMIVGTPAYMAPEQAGGQDLGPTADVWSLGATMYELLTGQQVFKAPSMMHLIQRIVSDEVTPVRQLRPQVPPAVEAVCMRCLRRDPSERYPTGQDVADDLRCILEGRRPWALPSRFWHRLLFWRTQ